MLTFLRICAILSESRWMVLERVFDTEKLRRQIREFVNNLDNGGFDHGI